MLGSTPGPPDYSSQSNAGGTVRATCFLSCCRLPGAGTGLLVWDPQASPAHFQLHLLVPLSPFYPNTLLSDLLAGRFSLYGLTSFTPGQLVFSFHGLPSPTVCHFLKR